MRDRDKSILGVAVVILVLGGIALWVSSQSRKRASQEKPPLVAIPSMAAEAGRGPGVGASALPIEEHRAGTVSSSGIDPATASATPEQRFIARMAETRAALMQKHRYPDESQPLSPKTDLLLPHHVEPVFRGLSVGGAGAGKGGPGSGGKVMLEQHQDRLYLMPGQNAVASFSAMAEGKPASITISRSDLVREAAEGRPLATMSTVTFHDDGVPPDDIASDGTWTGAVVSPTDGIASGLMLYVDVDSNGEKGTLAFPFIQTVSPPGHFTKTARAALESGSVAFYVGISLDRDGLYEIIARVYDSTGAPISYLRFLNQLTTNDTQVRLAAYGRLLLDEGAVPPLVLRDVEGHRMVMGQYPDREIMDEWAANFVTPKYKLSDFTSDDYVDPNKKTQLDALTKATQDGLANIGGSASPVDPAAPTTPPPAPSMGP